MRHHRFGSSSLALVALVALCWSASAGAGVASAACPLPPFGPGESYHPKLVRSGFTANVTNPWFPLTRGRTLVYAGVKDGKRALDLVMTSARTRLIDGVRTRIVEDRLYLDGTLAERTSDYYAQDRCGNVWYFGEDTATLDAHGRVTSTDGSFHAGRGGAEPGVFMQSRPRAGARFRQEWSPGHAEDTYLVLGASSRVRVAYGTFHHALHTAESTALEPAVLDNKYYARGIGELIEVAITGPREELRLVEVIR
jgi:hypothetical protein